MEAMIGMVIAFRLRDLMMSNDTQNEINYIIGTRFS